MTSNLKCGCKVIGDIINLNDDICGHNWNYMMRTFVNMCGKCGDKQLKFQVMENKLIDMEKSRMKMMTEEEEDETDPTDYEELKAHLKTMTEDERVKYRNFETLRNTANGFRPDYKMEKIYKAIKELKEEEEETDEESEEEHTDYDKYPKHWHTDPFLREHLIEQSRQAEEEMKMEEMRWVVREHSD